MNLFESHQNKVLVVGDVMLDKYWYGSTERISPEAPVPIVKVQSNDSRAGGAANVGLNLSALKVPSEVAGIVGCDSESEELSALLGQSGVDACFVRSSDKPTITKLRIMSRHQQLLRLDQEEPFSASDAAALREQVIAKSAGASVVVLSDYAKGSLAEVQSLIALFSDRKLPVLVDPKGVDFSRYRGATLLTPNMSEFEAVVGRCGSEEAVVQKAVAMLRDLELEALLLTRSERGMTLFQADKDPVYFAANAKAVFDVTGAGDTVIATLAAGIAGGLSLEQSVEIANIAAGIAVSKLGTDTVSLAELNTELMNHSGLDQQKVLDETTLIQALISARHRGEKVVFTNGCFDILHPGHVSYLNAARKLGDKLIVAVNSDASVSRLKGSSRPINDLEHRMHVLGGLASVDWVVAFEEDTPARIIDALLPDVLVKGGDYQLEEIVGADAVLASGGEVKVLNFEDGYSTTGIIEAAHQSSLK
ncbi:bifunctional D-glycero-beta-D-manno-heptose-7-phosphate kinase/D-glycero-beta-D-manno-heptose 1-phosphate adenylyltransferase HldE [Oceanospirillum linum]|uniref:Bifunctional protein HldE n=1 Tax=Oceanospirillum linum TaxID=966 RepID=A0A1T1H7P1_OCELI|nr:bifunctional D-glycero-beta-D-manno-heptose-7-phosphate kinase/D-glycero-beta-D-manno-heptose 1-phosphate adenylyltransferase HldE [Oceanospirillum linum]OOV85899.1 bifunctional heptose 7-phosphate kinase/heptose 1-phosphate adenyltransferase [Oceanospirillum linum]SEG51701.1 D-alpha,beta-D-heptose 7-phosphate 1-kinase /D-beta-D-heptose 1-phosphate adenylyltransferase [Oleiphilus messinensis]SMP35672.1 D-alpha,beta-D-heptose 7-phosphate 1-kinase /D-beta-D-heptose 1-phosphate adenylyltransfera